MGLDITAYSNLRAVGMHVATGWCEEDGHVNAFAYASFPQSFLGIPIIDQDGQSLYGGCYEITDETETFGFHAGSYGGYYRWRLDLAERFNPVALIDRSFVEPDASKPFYELIWFADNEGSIGPTSAAELLTDFRAHVDEALPKLDDYGVYSNFTRACELASADGLIRFH